MESVAAFVWNGWQASRGISGRLGVEYAGCRENDTTTSSNTSINRTLANCQKTTLAAIPPYQPTKGGVIMIENNGHSQHVAVSN